MTPIFPCDSRRYKGVPSGTGVPATSGRGAGDPQSCPNFRLWQMAISIKNATAGDSDLDQRYLRTRNSNDGCTVPPNIFASTPKIIPKPHFGGPFNAKPIIQIAVRKSHVNGATHICMRGVQHTC